MRLRTGREGERKTWRVRWTGCQGKQVFQQVQVHLLQSHLVISYHQVSHVKEKILAPIEYTKFGGGSSWINDGHRKRWLL